MNTQQARERVAETFPQPFNKAKFLEFTRNLLNKFDESKAQPWNATYVKDAFKPHVARFERLGTYTSPDDEKLDVLIVHLTNESKLERARTAIRNFVADHLKQRDGKDAALVAFVSPTERQWRFSYVKMEYAARETESGKVGVETRLTPARRFSYIVGEGESCHTAQTRFLALLQDTENYPTLAQLEEAFSVEAVTKEFFNQYAALFSGIEAALQKIAAKDPTIGKEFKAKNVSTVDFAKKLMGQIVFLYFLQKKGWLGVAKGQDWGTGPHDFLRRLVGQASSQSPGVNIFNDVLEPLFYDTLATDRGHEAWCNRFKCRIPFLNGGLFEPIGDYDWRKTDIILPNKLFTNTEPNEAGDIGTGVLDVFDRYNFTVNEAEPLEKDVAIDPEMLGKVFENLIEENRRKGLGAFYTPREIVHYKCQECLINYLDTALNKNKELVPRKDIETFIRLGEQISHYEAVDAKYPIKMPQSIEKHARLIDEKLASITVCDPAVGSGAYPVGMMTEIVRARCALTPYFNDVHERTPYHFKRHAIQNSLYGVDIDPGAVEIAKLRLWLSLVVDEEDAKQIKPLPNLYYKIVTGDSLLGVEKTLFNEKLFQEIERLKPQYFDETNTSKKASLKHQIDTLIHTLTTGNRVFDFEIYFSEVFHKESGFDIVIANPPYLFLSGKGSPVQQLVKAGKNAQATELKALLETYARRFPHSSRGCRDLYKWFVDLAFHIVKPTGVVSFITPNTYIVLKNYADLRQILLSDNSTNVLLDLGFGVFEIPIVPSAVFIARRTPSRISAVSYCDLKEVERSMLLQQTISTLVEKNRLEVPVKGTEVLLYKHPLAEKLYAACDTTLHNYSVISEGEHGMVVDPERVSAKPAGNTVPAIQDSLLSRLTPTKIVHIPRRDCPSFDRDVHSGDRFFLRKTGDRIVAAPPPNFDLAVAHQNVYVGHAKTDEANVRVLLGLLNSSLLTFLYQNGIYGQKGRTLAQFRIYALYLLPFPDLRKRPTEAISLKVTEILQAKRRNPDANTSALERELDREVYALYGLAPDEIAQVEASAHAN